MVTFFFGALAVAALVTRLDGLRAAYAETLRKPGGMGAVHGEGQ